MVFFKAFINGPWASWIQFGWISTVVFLLASCDCLVTECESQLKVVTKVEASEQQSAENYELRFVGANKSAEVKTPLENGTYYKVAEPMINGGMLTFTIHEYQRRSSMPERLYLELWSRGEILKSGWSDRIEWVVYDCPACTQTGRECCNSVYLDGLVVF